MIIDLSGFLDETVTEIPFNDSLKLDSIYIDGKDRIFTEPVKVSGHVYKLEGTNYLTSDVSFKHVENCDRCLKEFTQNIKTSLSGELREKPKETAEVNEKDDEVSYYEGNKLNLKQPIINTIILSLPMKSLCGEDCKGLCPKCGKNLNKGQCECVVEEIDPRLEKLKDFFE